MPPAYNAQQRSKRINSTVILKAGSSLEVSESSAWLHTQNILDRSLQSPNRATKVDLKDRAGDFEVQGHGE
jgi:hypothetical protein